MADMKYILEIPNTVVGWSTTVGFLITGVFALISIFNTSFGKKMKETNENEDRVIKLQRERIDALEEALELQRTDLEARFNNQSMLLDEQKKKTEELEKNLKTMYEENLRFSKYLERRDPEDVAYRKRGKIIFDMVEKAMPLVVETNTNMAKLVVLLETHFKPLTDVKPVDKLVESIAKS